jgi:uncharacterized damage-inducible protein DinB
MTAAELRTHLKYSNWASCRLIEAMRALSAEDQSRDLKASHQSVIGTLTHILFADAIWYSRVVDPSAKVHAPGDILSDAELAQEWRDTHRNWERWAESLTDADLDRVVEYKSLKGDPFSNTVRQIVMHVVNHATLHRGQAMAMMRQLGVAPPPTDLIFFYREQH